MKSQKSTVLVLLILNLVLAVSIPTSIFWRWKVHGHWLKTIAIFFMKSIPLGTILGIYSLCRLRKVPKESYRYLRRIAMGAAFINALVGVLLLAYILFVVLVLYFDPPY